jgi:hypothetical protein
MRLASLLIVLIPTGVSAQEQALVEGRFAQALDTSKGGFVADGDPKFGQFPVTAELWFKANSHARGQVLLGNEMRASGTSWRLGIEAGTGRLLVELPGHRPARFVASTAAPVNEWTYAAIVIEPQRCRVYSGGQLVIDQKIQSLGLPAQTSGFGIGMSADSRNKSAAWVDEVRVSSGVRDIVGVPDRPTVKDETTIALWSFDESKKDYLSKWTPSGATNQAGLPYPHREAGYEFEKDPDWADARWQETDKGRFITHSTLIPKRGVSPKSVTIFPGKRKDYALMFDLLRCGVMAVASDATFKIDEFRFGLLKKPTLEGQLRAYVLPTKLWRDVAMGRKPVDPKFIDYKKLTTNPGLPPTLHYEVLGADFTESYRLDDDADGNPVLTRYITVKNLNRQLDLTIAELKGEPASKVDETSQRVSVSGDEGKFGFAIPARTAGVQIGVIEKDVILRFTPGRRQVAIRYGGPNVVASASNEPPAAVASSEPEWGPPLVTQGKLADSDTQEPWVIDTITVPFENPHKALFYITALDFFPDGRAAVATAHGDVWIVSGLDASLSEVRWQRFATGLYQPLGLEIGDGKVFVLGRDQITRLLDTDNNGEADVYESFNNDLVITGTDHAYAMRLERDGAGNFFFLKSGEPPHGKSLLRVTPDGRRLEVLATGFRHPYGMGLSPNGDVTVADNEGPWVPSSKIDLIRRNGFYGFLGDKKEAPAGVRRERPLCWIPKIADNSSGGQMWNTSSNWGPYHRGGMLHLSWGRCTMHAVLRDVVRGVHQGATVRFPGLTFLSGSGEAEFNPKDGQLYVVGLDGWQTGAIQDGCFQRVRYTGKPVFMPSSFRVFGNGIEVGFSEPLDKQSLADAKNYRIEQWNYAWTSTYGSFHYSVKDPKKVGHDSVEILDVSVAPDGRSIFLKTNPLRSVDQIHVHTDVTTPDGRAMNFDIYGTIKQMWPARR